MHHVYDFYFIFMSHLIIVIIAWTYSSHICQLESSFFTRGKESNDDDDDDDDDCYL